MEAEYNALGEACQELIWLRRLFKDLEETLPGATTIYEDNTSCISFVKTERTTKRSKHIDTKQYFIKELVEHGEVELVYCCTELMVADALTKPLSCTRLNNLLERMVSTN